MKKRWFVLAGIFGLPAFLVARRIEWWFHEESGLEMAAEFSLEKLPHSQPDVARSFASEVCGEPVEFDRMDRSTYWTMMPEKAVARHFTLYGLFRNTIWVAIGMPGRFCLARFEIAMRRHGCVWPFPYCNYASWKSLDEVRLLERKQTRPNVSRGTQSLLPGECAFGELPAGTTARLHVEIPGFGQPFQIYAAGDNRGEVKLDVQIAKNGQEMKSYRDQPYADEAGGGSYEILLSAPPTDSKRYLVQSYWGMSYGSIPFPQGWRDERSPLPGTK